jgi:hypothetical protein
VRSRQIFKCTLVTTVQVDLTMCNGLYVPDEEGESVGVEVVDPFVGFFLGVSAFPFFFLATWKIKKVR